MPVKFKGNENIYEVITATLSVLRQCGRGSEKAVVLEEFGKRETYEESKKYASEITHGIVEFEDIGSWPWEKEKLR
jgi:hypothetical protein